MVLESIFFVVFGVFVYVFGNCLFKNYSICDNILLYSYTAHEMGGLTVFYLGTESEFFIEEITREKWSLQQGLHSHESYEVYYLVEGSVLYHIDDEIYSVNEGDFVCIPPWTPHKTSPCECERHKRILIQFKPAYINKLAEDAPNVFNNINVFSLPDNLKAYIITTLELLIEENNKGNKKNLLLINSIFILLLVLMERHYKSGVTASGKSKSKIPQKLAGVMKYINDNYSKDLKLSVLAKKFYIHPTYLSNLFKRDIGLSYVKYLNEVRIHKAIELLSSTECKVIDVAVQCGFNSNTHFGRVFKSIMAMSPLKYREITKLKNI